MLTRFKDVKFEHLPFLPDCLMIHSEHGDPATGPSHILSRMTPGCVIPWHWHSPNEYMLIVSGAYENQPRGEAAFIMHSGDYRLITSIVECAAARNHALAFSIPTRLLTFTGLTRRATTFQSQMP